MARPIKETPILSGKDAERFHRLAHEVLHDKNRIHKITQEEYDEAKKNFDTIWANRTFDLT